MGRVQGPLCSRLNKCECGFTFTCRKKQDHKGKCDQSNEVTCPRNQWGIHVGIEGGRAR